jgi:hypothetical protein
MLTTYVTSLLYTAAIYCYAYVDDTSGDACMIFLLLFKLGAFRIQNLQRTHVKTPCIPVRITLFQSCLGDLPASKV